MLPLVTGENQLILREKAKPVPQVTKAIKKLVKEMEETLIGANGLGLAAPQIGQSIRLFLVYLHFDTPNQRLEAFINPEITTFSEEKTIKEEGCLSLPGRYGDVERSLSVTVTYTNLKGQSQTLNLTGLDARVVQHENEHLDGILFIDKEIKKKSRLRY